jgi:UDP-N-acetylglucosamine:LPS N-acetylglucosamine transferase
VRVLILSAAIGEGHDLPARWLADGLREEAPGAEVRIADGLAMMSPFLARVAIAGSDFESALGNRLFDLEHWLLSRVAPTRAFAGAGMVAVGGSSLIRAIARERADVVVSTYPGVTEPLGRLRAAGRLGTPVVSAITDLASLRFWAHPGVDVHLVTHPESVEEVRATAGERTAVVPVRGLNDSAFLEPFDRAAARQRHGLPADAPVVVVSGGGWGVGDLAGAIDDVLARPEAVAVAVCGRNEELRAALAERYAAEPRVRVLGFTDDLPDLFAAADALVHSTAGLTVLEAHVRGCPTISYGWGRGHIRANNEAFERFGLAEVARRRRDLGPALDRALAARRSPDLSFRDVPTAASVVLELGLAAQREDAGHGGEHRGAGDGQRQPGDDAGGQRLAERERGDDRGEDDLGGDDDRADARGGQPLERRHLRGQREAAAGAGQREGAGGAE